MTIIEFLLGVLVVLAIGDLMVGVSNDAVNFLNSSIGSKVAPKHILLIIASLGLLLGVTFASGMMEVARQGIFRPALFTMPELMVIFVAVMLSDVILLDIYNTYGLPTSTTVSIVFGLLGAAVASSAVKVCSQSQDWYMILNYINTEKVGTIISGIFISVLVAFVAGAVVQFGSRVLFTFHFTNRLRYYGAIWGGLALAFIIYFLLSKGASGASFLSAEQASWMKNNAGLILLYSFVISTIVLKLLQVFFKLNIFKVIILAGTFALAMAFAANDLVNFIGVPLAGVISYQMAHASADPYHILMGGMAGKVPTNTWVLLVAGAIMVATLWFSKKIRTVSGTELGLVHQDEGVEKFESSHFSRALVRVVTRIFRSSKMMMPMVVRATISRRMYRIEDRRNNQERPSFDLLRASVNLVVASALVSFATAMKLPLSTTYVTFMVSMGTSFADQAWGRDSASYRVNGVIYVILGWVVTALIAFSATALVAAILSYSLYLAFPILALFGFLVYKNHRLHKEIVSKEEDLKVFKLEKISDLSDSIKRVYEHNGIFLKGITHSLEIVEAAIYAENLKVLTLEKKKVKTFQVWANTIIANSFKTLRLYGRSAGDEVRAMQFSKTIGLLQELVAAHRDYVLRSFNHVSNCHNPFLPEQQQELATIMQRYREVIAEAAEIFQGKRKLDLDAISVKLQNIDSLIEVNYLEQLKRIKNGDSKTRLSILYFGLIGNVRKISRRTANLLELYQNTFHEL